MTSLSLPTPDGSITTRVGAYCSITCCKAVRKLPTRLQQMQPEFISVIWMPASLRNPPSTPISPNSFSISTSFWPAYASPISFLIRVVLPAPRKPEKMSILVILYKSFLSVQENIRKKKRPLPLFLLIYHYTPFVNRYPNARAYRPAKIFFSFFAFPLCKPPPVCYNNIRTLYVRS